MAIGGYLKKLLSSTNPRPEDFRYPADREETRDKSPQYMEEKNERAYEPSDTMKEYLEGVDDGGHVSIPNKASVSKESHLQPDAARAAKEESDTLFKQEDFASFGADQDPNDDIKKAMRRSILSKLAGDYY